MTQRGADGLWELRKDVSLLGGGWHSAGDWEPHGVEPSLGLQPNTYQDIKQDK